MRNDASKPGMEPFDVRDIVRFTYTTQTWLVMTESFTVTMENGILRFEPMLGQDSKELAVDEDVFAGLSRAIEAGDVWQWLPEYWNPGVLDGTDWALEVEFKGGGRFESRGVNEWPEGYEAFVEGLVGLFE